MPTIDLTDQEVADLAGILDALGGGSAGLGMPFLVAIGGPWTMSVRGKLSPSQPALMSNEAIRGALGQFAATQATQGEVDTLRGIVDAYAARDTDARDALVRLGVDMTDAKPFAVDAFTDRAQAKIAADAAVA